MTAVLEAPWIESEIAGRTEREPASRHTTLFDLISALQDTAGPDDDAAVVAAVVDLLQTGHIRFLHGTIESN